MLLELAWRRCVTLFSRATIDRFFDPDDGQHNVARSSDRILVAVEI